MMIKFKQLAQILSMHGFDEGHTTLTINRDGLHQIINILLADEPFEEGSYLDANPDVRQAIESGKVTSGKEHYRVFGYYEGRFPGFGGFDANNYIEANPDLSFFREEIDWDYLCRQHYRDYGFSENRKIKT